MGLTTTFNDIDIFVHPRYIFNLHFFVLSFFIIMILLHFFSNLPAFVEQIASHGFEALPEGFYNEEYQIRNLAVYQIKKNGVRTEYQLISPLSPWVDCVYENVYTRKVDGRLFTNTLLRDFDLTICRCAIFDSNYVQRRAGKSVIKLYLEGNREARVVKYFNRLNLTHFSMI